MFTLALDGELLTRFPVSLYDWPCDLDVCREKADMAGAMYRLLDTSGIFWATPLSAEAKGAVEGWKAPGRGGQRSGGPSPPPANLPPLTEHLGERATETWKFSVTALSLSRKHHVSCQLLCESKRAVTA